MLFLNSLNDWTLFGIIFTGIIIVLGIAEFIRHYKKWAPESTRQFVHIFIGLIVASGPFIFKVNIQLIALSILFIVINMILLISGKVKSMHATERKSYGTVYFPTAVLIMSYFWWDKPISFILAIIVLTIADPTAAFIGKNGRTTFIPWRDKKSRRGSLAMFGTTTLIIIFGTDILARIYQAAFLIPLPVLIGLGIFTAFSAALAESISFRGSDNLSTPLITFLSYEIFLINYTHGTLPQLLVWTSHFNRYFFLGMETKIIIHKRCD